MSVERIKTGVPGFDVLVDGGVPRNSVVLLSGSPGTGKTLFALQTVVNACKRGDKGVFITFEQSQEDLYSQARLFGWNLEKLVSSGVLVIRSVDVLTDMNFLENLPKEIKSLNAQVLVIDSLTALQNSPAMMRGTEIIKVIATNGTLDAVPGNYLTMHESTIKRLSIHYLINRLKLLGVTAFVISNIRDDEKQLSSDGISEFLADGLVLFYYVGISGEEARSVQVRKMRWTKQKKGFFPFDINNSGLKIQSEGTTVMMK